MAMDKNAAALGRKGGLARALALTPAQRSASARKAALERWRKWREQQKEKL